MPSLDSDKVDAALRNKMRAEVDEDRRHYIYTVADDEGYYVATTAMSKGGKQALGANLVSKMARDLGLKTGEMTDMVRCPLSREAALAAIMFNRQQP